MPQLLRDLLNSGPLASPDVIVLGASDDGAGLLALCEAQRPDVVVLQADDSLEAQLEWTTPIDRAIRIVAVTPSGRSARMHHLRWQVDVVPEVSFGELRDAILGATHPASAKAP
jgi:hypothetical protein